MGHPLHSQPSQEYPIRALVRGDNYGSMDKRLAGTVRQWKSYDRRFMTACDLGGCDCRGKSEWYCGPEHLIIDPSPEQIAEERAKAGLPAAEGEALPERSEGAKAEPTLGDALKVVFMAGYSAGHASGMNEASDDIMRHNDSPDAETAWAEFMANHSEDR